MKRRKTRDSQSQHRPRKRGHPIDELASGKGCTDKRAAVQLNYFLGAALAIQVHVDLSWHLVPLAMMLRSKFCAHSTLPTPNELQVQPCAESTAAFLRAAFTIRATPCTLT